MGVKLFSLQILFCASVSLNVLRSTQSTTLTGSDSYIFEYTDFTLRCTNDGNKLGDIRWTRKTPLPLQKAAMSVSNSVCVPYGFLINNPLYTYDCTDDKAYLLTLKNISRGINGQIWTCGGGVGIAESNDVTVSVYVPVTSSTLSPNRPLLTESENKTISLTCTSSECKPEPKFQWYKNNSVMTDRDGIFSSQTVAGGNGASEIQPYINTLALKLTRELNECFLFCAADNQNGRPVSSGKIRLNVTYPPDRPPSIHSISNTGEVKVFQNDNVNIGCSVTGGNPLPRLEWNKYSDLPMTISGNTVSKNISWIATDLNPVELICQSIHRDGDKYAYITINTLYPPDKSQIMIRTSSGVYEAVPGMVSVIEYKPFTLNCSARSNPPVSLFKWNELSPAHDSFIYNMSVDRHHSKPITCEVSNVMKTSDSRPSATGKSITQVVVNVLYPPTITPLGEGTVIEGDNIDYSCNFTQGNPNVTDISWSWNGKPMNGLRLQIRNVSRSHAGLYRCTVGNVMMSSDGSAIGNDSGVFNLSVQYKSNVLELLVNEYETSDVTVNENDAVNISCEIEGNPLPTGELLHQRTSFVLNQQSDVQTRNSTFRTLSNLYLTHSFLAQCTDTGVQTCRGISWFYNGRKSESTKSISLFVKCKPRKSPFFTIVDTVRSPTSVDVTLSFTTLAFPVPPQSGYVWSRQIESNSTWDAWANITSLGHKTSISSWGLQSNLTIRGVSQFDYGLYRLFIENGVGQFNYTFSLIPGDYINGENSASSSNVSVVAASAAGAGVFMIAVIIAIILFYRRRKSLSYQKQDMSIQYYNFNNSKVNECNISKVGGSANAYEAIQHTGYHTGSGSDGQYDSLSTDDHCKANTESDSKLIADGSILHVYEGLQNANCDQQYEKISPFDKGQHLVYENLQLTRTPDGLQDVESSNTVPVASGNEKQLTELCKGNR